MNKDSIRRYGTEIGLMVILLLVLLFHATLDGIFDRAVLIIGTLCGVLPVFYHAFRSLREREWASMDTLASLALTFSMIEGEWSSAAFIALMLGAARLLEMVTEERMEKNIRGLMKLKPAHAKRERDGTLETVPVEEIVVGDIVVIDAGERIPIDGVVLSGMATVDESSLTGESLPIDKNPKDSVASSTLLVSGSVRVETTRVGKDTTLERIIALVESARDEKPNIETLGQRFGKIYLISIFIGAGLIYAFTQDVQLVLAVVLVVCADDVAIAIPLAYLRAIGTAAKRGIVIKGGRHLEVLGKVDTIVFDKTGTLTRGKPRVTALKMNSEITEEAMLTIAAPLAYRSTHPLSRAIIEYCEEKGLTVADIQDTEVRGGKGVIAHKGQAIHALGNEALFTDIGIPIPEDIQTAAVAQMENGKTISYVGQGTSVLGFFALGDEMKTDARGVIERLRALGIKRVVMLSGDNERAAQALAREAGIDECHAHLLPEDKVAKLKELSARGVVAMVGDGVNDAAALSIAHVGIAMGGLGSDGAIESANIVLMHDNLNAIPEAIELARDVRKISIQDFYIWGFSNVLGLSLVFMGFIGPAGAAAYNFISDFFPLINSMRAKFKQ